MVLGIAWVVVISHGSYSAGVFLSDVARALRHGLLIPVMLSGILAAVAMELWECCLVCACSVVIGWKARGVLQAEASGSKTEPPPAANGQAQLEHSGIHKQK